VAAALYDGYAAEQLAQLIGAPHVELFEQVASTMDIAHHLARQGAPTGTIVLADTQTAGRGRQGRVWQSQSGRGIWMTLIARPHDSDALSVLSLRVGIVAARLLDGFAGELVRLKWPNDLYLRGGKLAGILVEARWRESQPEWLAIGFGLNVAPPDGEGVEASGLLPGTQRVEVLTSLVPALRAACSGSGALDADELRAFDGRDIAKGRRCTEPAPGHVAGVNAHGELLVDTGTTIRSFRSGSLVLMPEKEEGRAP